MGEVMTGVDPHLRRRIALKVVKRKLAGKSRIVERFRVEMQVLAQLEHPGILPLYSAEHTADGRPAFAMKYVDGGTMHDLLSRCVDATIPDPDPPGEHGLAERLDVFIRLCEAVSYAHHRGVLHRDLKPSNVMLGEHREVYLTDWGLARVVGAIDPVIDDADDTTVDSADAHEPSAPTATRYGRMLGTPTWMSPEQANGELDRMGPWSDQFSLGMILQTCVTLASPRPIAEPDVTRRMARSGTRSKPRHVHGHRISPTLLAIIAKATAHAPEDRYPSAAHLAEDVRRHLLREETVALPDSPLRRMLRVMANHPIRVLGAVLVLVLVAAASTTLSLRRAIEAERVAHADALGLAALTREVTGHASRLDRQMARVMVLLEGVGRQARTLLEDTAARETTAWIPPTAFSSTAPERIVDHPRYPFPVRFDRGVAVGAPQGDPASMQAHTARLAPALDGLRDLMVGSEDRGFMRWSADDKTTWLNGHTPPVHVAYLGLEDGLLLNYPGYADFDPDYDPRRRPWYHNAVGTTRPVWGPPYPDVSGSGILVPCNLALYGEDGAMIGVAGADMHLGSVVSQLTMPGLRGFVQAVLVHNDGTVIARSRDASAPMTPGLNDDKPMQRAPYEVDAVREAIVAGSTGGATTHGDDVVVWHRTSASGWTLAVHVTRSAWLHGGP